MSSAMRELIEAVERGEWPAPHDWLLELPPLIWQRRAEAYEAFNGSLDAALALHQAVLPGWDASVGIGGFAHLYEPVGKKGWGWADGPSAEVDGNPARAWLLAILRALASQETTDE